MDVWIKAALDKCRTIQRQFRQGMQVGKACKSKKNYFWANVGG
jgi:hypothetical protein